MTWLLLAYAAVAYWHFRATLRSIQPYDTVGTTLLCASLALIVGPCLLLAIVVLGLLARH